LAAAKNMSKAHKKTGIKSKVNKSKRETKILICAKNFVNKYHRCLDVLQIPYIYIRIAVGMRQGSAGASFVFQSPLHVGKSLTQKRYQNEIEIKCTTYRMLNHQRELRAEDWGVLKWIGPGTGSELKTNKCCRQIAE